MSKPLHAFAFAAATALALVACAQPSPIIKDDAMPRAFKLTDTNRQPVRQWPLRFDSHSFSVFTYDTYGARLHYAGMQQIDQDPGKLRRSSASYGPDYQGGWSGSHGMIRNFPAPAKVSWQSRDGDAHAAEIDFGEIFKDELIRHNVAREDVADMPDGLYRSEPDIILEINDRTIRVYMQAFMPLKREIEVAGVMRNEIRDEPVLVKTYSY